MSWNRKKPSGAAVFGGLVLMLLGLLSFPLVLFLGTYIGVQVVLLILAHSYWSAFWWCCLYSLFYLVVLIIKLVQE